ncbi:MAG TPA: chromosome segregation protein SMC [Acidimicrobiales bacterium]|nr:chromosome segregation protein SMC [Acidimicrobiales bacterium]
MNPAVYLKSLSLRGFKSFADPTTLEFEPGVTVIVGPNGSGKSNVVDAVAWVLGAQGPRVVRSSKMDDVIFAGTSKRPALGRAEVSLTIDNSSGRLPVDLAEVTITRTLFRSGESEYSMNGVACRLLDIQELLSDAGVGRQQHVIMGQGQLDTILQARPEERRAVIEEAAGILKFRRRRERAERRIESTEANLLRLQDLHREVRRQLRPLERQAEAARRHDSLAAELRALQLHVAGNELRSLQQRLSAAEASRLSLEAEDGRRKAELARLDELVASSEASLDAAQSGDVAPLLAAAERLSERARGVANVIEERRRSVALVLAQSAQADVVASLESEAARIEAELAETSVLAAELVPEREALDSEAADLAGEETAWSGRAGAGGHSPSEAAAEVARLRRSRDGVRDELAVVREAVAAAIEREAALAQQIAELEVTMAQACRDAERRRVVADEARAVLVAAEDAERQAAAAVMATEATAREALGRSQGLTARAHALQLALDEARARAGVEHLAGRPGVLGTLLDVVELDEGCELAFEAGVANTLRAVVVEGSAEARNAIEHLRASGVDGSVILADPARRPPPPPVLPAGVELLRSCVRATDAGVAPLLDRLLAGVILCRHGLAAALHLLETLPVEAVVVTLEGDRFSADEWRLGAGRAGATKAALEVVRLDAVLAGEEAAATGELAEVARRDYAEARLAASERGRLFAAASAEERQSRAQAEELARRLQLLREQAPGASAALGELRRRVSVLGASLEAGEAELGTAERFEREIADVAEVAAAERRRLDERARSLASRRSEWDVRAAGLGERRHLLAERRRQIDASLEGCEAARAEASDRRQAHETASRALERLAAVVDERRRELAALGLGLRERRSAHAAAVASITARLSDARRARGSAERELEAARERLQRVELELAELRVRLEAAVQSLRHDLETEPAEALAAGCPELPPGTPPVARVRELERELRLLGPVNPLALEELAALEERDAFLAAQLNDVRAARRELSRVVRAVDEEIVNGFTEAFADVARHFEVLFSTLFPGGTGRLTLVDPSDLLSTGVEVEARPAGRNVRRLSLLSGGERSLVALAYLFAVFRSRPSPFYLMDEVEAALDDINLHRFLDLMDEFRGEAQLLVVSHQKRTMESADILYGVSLQPGGASKVVSERLGTRQASRTG